MEIPGTHTRYTDGRAEIDNGTGATGDDPNRTNSSRRDRAGACRWEMAPFRVRSACV